MADNFDDIVSGLDITPAFDYVALPVSDNAPEAIVPNRRNRQWALVDADGRIASLGPATGGGKSAFIAYAAAHPGFTVAHRWVESGAWLIPGE